MMKKPRQNQVDSDYRAEIYNDPEKNVMIVGLSKFSNSPDEVTAYMCLSR
jgi:hypothetical protein